MNTVNRTLVFSWGNPSRGDDALGPLFAQAIEAMNLPDVDCLTDFQLQIEHALDLQGRERVLFVDASCQAAPDSATPFQFGPLTARRDDSYTTHAMSPAALLQVFADMEGQAPPPAWLLAIPGDSWELGDPPSARAQERLDHALRWATTWLASTDGLAMRLCSVAKMASMQRKPPCDLVSTHNCCTATIQSGSTMFTNTPFESFAKSLSVTAPKFDPAVMQDSMKLVQDNLKAWGALAQSQAQAAQASITETMESFKAIKEPQAAFEVLKTSAENNVALATKNLKAATALSVEQFNATLDAIEKAHPAPEAFAGVAKGLKAAVAAAEQALDSALKTSAVAVANATPAKKSK